MPHQDEQQITGLLSRPRRTGRRSARDSRYLLLHRRWETDDQHGSDRGIEVVSILDGVQDPTDMTSAPLARPSDLLGATGRGTRPASAGFAREAGTTPLSGSGSPHPCRRPHRRHGHGQGEPRYRRWYLVNRSIWHGRGLAHRFDEDRRLGPVADAARSRSPQAIDGDHEIHLGGGRHLPGQTRAIRSSGQMGGPLRCRRRDHTRASCGSRAGPRARRRTRDRGRRVEGDRDGRRDRLLAAAAFAEPVGRRVSTAGGQTDGSRRMRPTGSCYPRTSRG